MHLKYLFSAASAAAILAGCAGGTGVTSAPSASGEEAAAPAPAAATTTAAPEAWVHEASDLKPDPAVRFGRLPNGMKYAIVKNATPAGQASLRLRIDAGSLMEQDNQQGVAHFLEHMVLNGTKNVPEGEMIRRLERAGLAFGPDTNASTSFDETIYKLDLPKTDAETVGTALYLLREVADEASLESAAIDRERGIILSEERSRDTPGLRIAKAQLGHYFKGQRLSQRLPIGQVEVIRNAPRERFVDFYNGYYRPERATLVAVGDFDVDDMERRIREGFSGWRAEGPAAPEPELGQVAPRSTEARLLVEPGGPTIVEIAWLAPPDMDPDTRAERREDWIRGLGLAVLNRRFQRLSLGSNPPFVQAQGSSSTQFDTADVTSIQVVAQPGKWREALTGAEQEQRRLVTYGVSQAELDREITEIRAQLAAAVAGAATRRSPVLAEGIVSAVNEEQVFTAPSEDLAVFEEAVKALTAEAVSAELKRAFTGQGPLVFMTTPQAIEGGEPALAQAFTQSRQVAVAAPAVVEAKAWAYTDFGTPGQVAERREVADLQTTFVRFANGVRLTVKPTKLREDQILVAVRAGDGRLDQPRTRASDFWAGSGGNAFMLGGLQDLTYEEMQQALASKVYSAGFDVEEDAFVMAGGTRPEDFAVQMQVLAAYASEPGWRPEGFELFRSQGAPYHDQLQSTPAGVLQRDLPALLRSGDRRWATPSREEIAAGKPDALWELLRQPLTNEPLEVVVVGDVTVDEAIRQTAATFGALPARKAAQAPADARRVSFPKGSVVPVRLTHKGRADQGVAFIAWPTADFGSDMQRARELRLLEQVLQLRLTEKIREKQGVTYSPQSGYEASWVFPDYGYVSAVIEAPPEKLDAFFADAQKIARELRQTPVTADELDRARRPRIGALERSRASNEYWLATLHNAQTDPRRLESIREVITGLERVTPADIQRVARAYLSDHAAWKLVVTPEAQPAATGGR